MAMVVVAEKIADDGLRALRAAGHVVNVVGPDGDLDGLIGTADALVVRSATAVDADLLSRAPHLRVVGRAGVGVDNVDVDAATAHGVLVLNAPDANVLSAAEHAIALMLAVCRNVVAADARLRQGHWERERFSGVELAGKTLGLLGLGRVGSLVAERVRSFGVRVVAFDPFVAESTARDLGVELMERDEVLARSDLVSVHLPKNAETTGLLSTDTLARMKPGAFLVNTSRGGIVDEAALAATLTSGHLAGAALDVFATEPTTSSPLFALDQVVVTPHLGASTAEAQRRAGVDVAEGLIQALDGRFVATAVNLRLGSIEPAVEATLPAVHMLGQLLAAIATEIRDEVNVKVTGALGRLNVQPVVLAAVAGVATTLEGRAVAFVEVDRLVERRGWSVSTTKLPGEGPVRVELRTGPHRVVADFGPEEVRLSGVDAYDVDLPLRWPVLLIRHADVPGMIGAIGTVLGHGGVNVDDLHIGRGSPGEALTALTPSGPVTASTVDALAAVAGVRGVRFVDAEVPR